MVRSVLKYGHKGLKVFDMNKKSMRYDFVYDYDCMILSFLYSDISLLSIYWHFLLLRMRNWFVHRSLPLLYDWKNWQTLYYTFLRLSTSVLSLYQCLFLLRIRTWYIHRGLFFSNNSKDWQPLHDIFLSSVASMLLCKLAKTFELFYSLASIFPYFNPIFFLFYILWYLVFVSTSVRIGFGLHWWQARVSSLSKSNIYIVPSWIVDISCSILVLDSFVVFFRALAWITMILAKK